MSVHDGQRYTDDLERYVAEACESDPEFAAALAREERRQRLVSIAEEVIAKWVDTAYRIASATFGSEDERAQTALQQMRHLHLAEPWLPATAIADAVEGGRP